QRTVHWGPRSIDLDLIAFDDQIIQSAQLSLPHPACWYRRFVLDPFVEIAPGWRHPERNIAVLDLQLRLLNRPLILDLSSCDASFIDEATKVLSAAFFPQELQLITDKAEVTTEEATWKILEQGTSTWENAKLVSRLDLQDLPSPTANALVDVVRSAMDSPQRIEEFDTK
ncbi:MAG: 2-amino-4-hydroxy-6-hydroxymethyldihydropteridine diphosphokinase, partial [Planctomycetaceae bacterium]|nr:2-amino-4-hydroxy-6-hydroxymethyldihydropteridine diphosphokinase [Planctomycetaceae bacterium]